jgi:hypothetical protein
MVVASAKATAANRIILFNMLNLLVALFGIGPVFTGPRQD